MSIPTPQQVKDTRFTTVAGQAESIKQSIIDVLGRGKNRLDLPGEVIPNLQDILKKIEPDFTDAGWQIVNHGLSLTIRPIE